MELRPNFASIVRDLDEFSFTDEKWMKSRTRNFDKPLNIYEMHLGSWKRKDADKQDDPDRKVEEGWYQYDEIAEDLIAYLKENHYTHVEFMPLSEHPFDGSWGYQNTGFFAPTARYGTAQQLQKLVNSLHRAGLGAIIDFVPAHFAMDHYALRHYDGSDLYEYPASDVSDSEWGSCNFLFSRREVACFFQPELPKEDEFRTASAASHSDADRRGLHILPGLYEACGSGRARFRLQVGSGLDE